MKKKLLFLINQIDKIIYQFFPRLLSEKNNLIIFTFHGVFRNKEERTLNVVDPRLFICLKDLRQFLEYFTNDNYTFVSPTDIIKGLKKNKNYFLISFDDGYYNNHHVLSILREYEIPALFLISTNHIKYNKSFWWDVLYREGINKGISIKEITTINKQMKLLTAEKCEKYLMDLYGKETFKPVSDIDRPFTISEIKNFSRDSHVFLGNHTSNHNILSKYSKKEISYFIISSQLDIYNFTGKTPVAISYPDGIYSKKIIEIAKRNGLEVGLTGTFKKNYLPIDRRDDKRMQLGRFNLYDCNNAKDCEQRYNLFVRGRGFGNLIFKNILNNE